MRHFFVIFCLSFSSLRSASARVVCVWRFCDFHGERDCGVGLLLSDVSADADADDDDCDGGGVLILRHASAGFLHHW